MSIIATRTGGNFENPPEGEHEAVAVDVIDKGLRPNPFQCGALQRKVDLVWELPSILAKQGPFAGQPLTVKKMYTLTLDERSTLYKDLTSWRGKAFTAEELSGFDLERLIGAPCKVVVSYAQKHNATFANVIAVLKTGQKTKPSGKYVRIKDRPGATGPTQLDGQLPF
jgi:hypothetical protein